MERHLMKRYDELVLMLFEEIDKQGTDNPLYDFMKKADLEWEYSEYKRNGKLYSMGKEWIHEQMRFFPEARTDVLTFIFDFVTAHGYDSSCYENMRSTFRAGYCYYFATILKTAFNRGEVCCAAPFGHFCWVDDNDIPYDIEGVYSGEAEYFIPYQKLGNLLDDFLHVEGVGHNATEEEIQKVIDDYKKEKQIEE